MNQDLERFQHEWEHGDREVAKDLARAYVQANRAAIAPILERYDLSELVQLVEAYREHGKEEDRIIADMWLLSEYAPQHIVGQAHIGSQPAVAAAEALLRGDE